MTKIPELSLYNIGYTKIANAITGLSDEILNYKPNPTAWSIHEIVIHLSDSEAQSYVRFRSIVADDNPSIPNHHESAWASLLSYQKTSLSNALSLIKLIRKMNYEMLTQLPESNFHNSGLHSVRGPETLYNLVHIYIAHFEHHIAQIHRNIIAFENRNPQGSHNINPSQLQK